MRPSRADLLCVAAGSHSDNCCGAAMMKCGLAVICRKKRAGIHVPVAASYHMGTTSSAAAFWCDIEEPESRSPSNFYFCVGVGEVVVAGNPSFADMCPVWT
ncbi:hypothetical protein TGRH88_027410 [Toxoplasma gondii]|uniref:Uncharacterized protein n=1 Tax=Toxoplasma gondii TaxID=5811 RepID=A0A7J6K943_TOXGO|nr:hypothetical protein TGRH88_027410 [Toxoplasma gondii]